MQETGKRNTKKGWGGAHKGEKSGRKIWKAETNRAGSFSPYELEKGTYDGIVLCGDLNRLPLTQSAFPTLGPREEAMTIIVRVAVGKDMEMINCVALTVDNERTSTISS
jgi:hypothetical protein